MLPLLLFFQASVPDTGVGMSNFDLRNLPAASDDGAIVVRGRRAEDVKALRTEDQLPDPILPRAEVQFIGRSRISVDADQRILGSAPSNRAMVTVKVPF